MSPTDRRKLYAEYEKQLTPFSTSLVAEFIRSADAIGDLLSDDELKEWAEDGLELARQSWRSWEAAGEYFRVAPQMLPMLGWDGFRRWGKHGRDLAELSSALAASYFRASPATLPSITFVRLGDWVNLGRLLYKGTWRSASLAVQFFDGSPAFFSEMTLEEARVLVRFVDALCDRSYDLASHCLSIAPHVLQPLGGEDRAAFLQFAEALASTGWADARSYLEKGPTLLAHVHSPQRVRFLALARELARREGRQAFTYFADAARALSQIDSESHGLLLSLSEELVDRSPVSAMEFLKTAATVLERIPLDEIALWHKAGSDLLEQSIEGGEAYFRLESSKGEEMLESLSSRVDLSRVSDILRMYCKALTGYEVAVHSAEALAEKGIGWVETEAPSTEGTAIFLPPWVEEFHDKDGNFHVYKVYSTHQAGHLEFGTFDFEFERAGRVFENRRAGMEQGTGAGERRTAGAGRRETPPAEAKRTGERDPGTAGILGPPEGEQADRESANPTSTSSNRPSAAGAGAADGYGAVLRSVPGPAAGFGPVRDCGGRADRRADLEGVRGDPARLLRAAAVGAGAAAGAGGDAAAAGVRREPRADEPRRDGPDRLAVVAAAADAGGGGRGRDAAAAAGAGGGRGGGDAAAVPARAADPEPDAGDDGRLGGPGRGRAADAADDGRLAGRLDGRADAAGRSDAVREPAAGGLPGRLQAGDGAAADEAAAGARREGAGVAAFAGAAQADAGEERRDHALGHGGGGPDAVVGAVPDEPAEGAERAGAGEAAEAAGAAEGRAAGDGVQHGGRRARAGDRAEVLLLRRVGLPRGRLPAALVPDRRVRRGRGERAVLRPDAGEARGAGAADAAAVRAAAAGDVPQDQAAAGRRGDRLRRGDGLRGRAAGRGTRRRTRSTGGGTRSSGT